MTQGWPKTGQSWARGHNPLGIESQLSVVLVVVCLRNDRGYFEQEEIKKGEGVKLTGLFGLNSPCGIAHE